MPNSIADNLTRLQNARIAIGNAIVAKGGTVNQGDGLEEYPADIATIPSGGVCGADNDVRFIDYCGMVIKSYTAEEFASLSALPDNPSHEGLIAQGWNWSLSDAKTYVANYGKLDIGQMYKSNTPNGDTFLHIRITGGRLKPYLGLTGNSAGTAVDIDWGDDTAAESVTLDNNTVYTPHEYATTGEYTIIISVTNGTISFNGSNAGYSNIFRKSSGEGETNADRVYQNILVKAEIGSGVTGIGNYAFQYCSSLSSISIPDTVTSIGNNAFQSCYSLSSITIPNTVKTIGSSVFQYCCSSLSLITIPDGVTSIGQYAFYGCYSLSSAAMPNSIISIGNNAFSGCYSLSSISIPSTVTSIGNNAFQNCYSLSSLIIPDGDASIGSSAFYGCYSLASITMPDTVASIGNNAFQNCYSLSSITIPNSVASIGSGAFQSCSGFGFIKFTRTTPPTVSASSAFTSIPTECIVYVPAEYIQQYKDATNYPDPIAYTYVGYGTYPVGNNLPSTTHDSMYSLTWYATLADWESETNPITVSTGSEAYARATLITTFIVTRSIDFVNNVSSSEGDVSIHPVYSSIKRCNVADDGTINAYDGDVGYVEDGTNGQVMVYIPKFYYKLDVSEAGSLDGSKIRKGTWSISSNPATGYTLHPAFIAADGTTELDYFLYGAFDAVGQDANGVYSTSYNTTSYKLGSVGGNTYNPSNNFTRATGRTMATNRGTGWYQVGIKQHMAVLMLFMVEYGSNSQNAVGYGIVNDSAAHNTGQTTGSITSGTKANKTTAVNWRGIENLWGNIWNYIDGINLNGTTAYICNTFNFVDDTSTGYTQIGFTVAGGGNWITSFGYDSNNDWILLPAETDANGSGDGTIGDKCLTSSGWLVCIVGGRWYVDLNAGAFYFGLNVASLDAYSIRGSRLMYIP